MQRAAEHVLELAHAGELFDQLLLHFQHAAVSLFGLSGAVGISK